MPPRERWAVHIKLKTGGMTPCSICVYVAFSYAAAHQFYAEREYPKSYSYFVRELRQPIWEDSESRQLELLED